MSLNHMAECQDVKLNMVRYFVAQSLAWFLLVGGEWKVCFISYALVICNHGPPPPGNSGDFDFSFFNPLL